MKKWRVITPFFVISLLHCIAILMFTRGFLLTRTELPHFSHCSNVSQSPCFSHSHSSLNQSQCWTKPAVDRLIIIVLDALRFDFVAPSTFFQEKRPWMDKLQVLQKLASTEGSSAKIFKAIADPPTTSLQRLKGLTTGGLPTFIDVGNSFGAPAIVEDNLIYQLVQNGKRVVMMGDDTWLQLFPHHFDKAYPYPSFNVKDLHTVDNGCVDHLFPFLYREDWDVLIAHFLGVDHAGHIHGVDSIPMIEKLEQYNGILDRAIEVLKNQSGPGGIHENTFLLVMGDHGQTINGDHGGGTAEEVETSIFAMSLKEPSSSIPSELRSQSCKIDPDGKEVCFSSIQQLDFAVTISALLGIPFPFGSIGHVNPELYALGAGTWNSHNDKLGNCNGGSDYEEWMHNYVNVLCVNSWQVKRFIDVYSASSVIGFSSEDMSNAAHLYAQAEEKRTRYVANSSKTSISSLMEQIDAYLNFLASVAELARSKWTEFDLNLMGVGFGVMLISLLIHLIAIKRAYNISEVSIPSVGDSGISLGLVAAFFVVAVRACSVLSNSYILEEGKVTIFLLATTAIINLRYSIMRKRMLLEVGVFFMLISIIRFTIEFGLSKQDVGSEFTNIYPFWIHGIVELFPVVALLLLAYLLHKSTQAIPSWGLLKYVIMGTISSYMLIGIHWTLEGRKVNMLLKLEEGIGRNCIPRIIYAIGFGQLALLALDKLFTRRQNTDCEGQLHAQTVGMISTWSPTIIILLGKQGPFVALASIIGGWCIVRLQHFNALPVTQWSLLAVCMFFFTGHWCAFDGLRYGAAFTGFDEFILIRQAALLTIDTFGFSHILPIFGLPFIVAHQHTKQRQSLFVQLSIVYLIYGLIMAMAVTFTIICVTIQRRHLMVWGLFAPKFVFDVVGLILADILICLASIFYFD